MSTETTDRDNQQWRSRDNRFGQITLKGAEDDVFEDGEILQFDPADGTYVKYAALLLTDLARAILSLGVGESYTIVAGNLTPPATACIHGEVIEKKLVYPGAVTIDDVPPNAVLSVREQLREVGIIARDTDGFDENHI